MKQLLKRRNELIVKILQKSFELILNNHERYNFEVHSGCAVIVRLDKINNFESEYIWLKDNILQPVRDQIEIAKRWLRDLEKHKEVL